MGSELRSHRRTKAERQGKGSRLQEALHFQPAQDGQGALAVRWEVGLEEGPGRPLGAPGREAGSAAALVLGDLAVVFGVDVPAQADGQEHAQELWGEKVRIRGGRAAQSPRVPCCPGQHTGFDPDSVDLQVEPHDQPVIQAAEGPGKARAQARPAAGPLEADRQAPASPSTSAEQGQYGRTECGEGCREGSTDLNDSDAHTHA